MFKKVLNNVKNTITKEKTEVERQPPKEKPVQNPNAKDFQEITDKPFEVDFDQIWGYEFEDLVDIIQQYEQFTNVVKNKYNDILHEFLMIKEKLTLLEQERRRLLNENEQYKVQNENLKTLLDESSPNNQSPKNKNPPLVKKVSQNSAPSIDPEIIDDSAVNNIRARVDQLVEELKAASEPLCHSILEVVRNHSYQNEHHESENSQVMNTEEYGGNVTEGDYDDRALDTDNNDYLDSARVGTKDTGKGNMEEVLKEVLKDSLGQALKRVGGEILNISNRYCEVFMKLKLKENDLAAKVQENTEAKGDQEDRENEMQELGERLREAEMISEKLQGELENHRNAFEEVVAEKKQLLENLSRQSKEAQELHKIIESLKEDLQKSERTQEELEIERDELQEHIEKIETEYQNVASIKERYEKELIQERQKGQKSFQSTEEEKKKLEKKLQSTETEKNDIENNLIQEKLKHHQTIADATKMKEKFEEVERHLNEEMQGRRADVMKYEELKKRFLESEKKMKDHKKTIKRLSQQILDLHNQKNQQTTEEPLPSLQTAKSFPEQESTEQNETEMTPSTTATEFTPDKDEIIHNQSLKIHQLEERLSEIEQELNHKNQRNHELEKEKKDLASQVHILKEKRELGLNEIKKLTQQLEQARGNSGTGTTEQSFNSPIRQAKTFSPPLSQSLIFSPAMKTQHTVVSSGNPDDLRRLRKIKKGLDDVYKEIIMAITNEKLHESENASKPSGKLGELVKGPLPSENFMKIEKRMNDSIVLLQEFMENYE